MPALSLFSDIHHLLSFVGELILGANALKSNLSLRTSNKTELIESAIYCLGSHEVRATAIQSTVFNSPGILQNIPPQHFPLL